MHTITFTRDNIVNSDNSRLVFDLPGGRSLEGAEIALSTLYMYYSWENVNGTTLNNNQFKIALPDLVNDATGAALPSPITGVVLTITLPDGIYEIADINSYFQQWSLDNNFYLINTTTGDNVYFLQIQTNFTLYKVQVNLFALPATAGTGIPAGYSAPPNGFLNIPQTGNPGTNGAFPALVGGQGQVIGPDFSFGNFKKIIGAPMTATGATYVTNPSNSFPPAPVASGVFPNGSVSLLSTITPAVNPNSVIFLNCNIVQNQYTNPQTVLYPIPGKTSLGGLLSIEPPEYAWNKCMPGTVGQLIVFFTDRTGQPIRVLDPDMVITLVIKDQVGMNANMAAGSVFGMSSSSESLRFQRALGNTQGPTPTMNDAIARHLKAKSNA